MNSTQGVALYSYGISVHLISLQLSNTLDKTFFISIIATSATTKSSWDRDIGIDKQI